MAIDYQVAALWIGGSLSFLEELCLKSFVDAGQHCVLFTYEGVDNVPEGVEIRDAADIMPNPTIHRHERTNSPALFSDRFRYVMLDKMDDTIWVDTDAYCMRRFTTPNGHFHGYEKPDGVNGGVLGLPKDSETLGQLLEFTSDPYAIPEWFPADMQLDYARRRDAGNPVHASEMPWGVWGPRALTHFLTKTGEIRYSLPQAALYPVHYRDRMKMTTPGADLSEFITDETFSIHFYGRRMRARISQKFGGVPRPRSLIGRLLTKHGIDPRKNPLPDLREQPETPDTEEA